MNKNIDFDLDDPLADFLSDKSDDSFFEDKIKTSNKPSRNSSLDKKKSNLFGLDDNTKEENVPTKESKLSNNSDWLGIKNSPVENRKITADVINVSTEKIEDKIPAGQNPKQNLQASIKPKPLFSSDNLNILDDLGLSDTDTNVPQKNVGASFMDDILGPSKPKTETSAPRNEQITAGYNPTSGSSKTSFVRLTTSTSKLEGNKNQQEPKPKTLVTKSSTDISTKSNKNEKSARRQRNADWLGLFTNEGINGDPLVREKDLSFSELLKSQDTTKAYHEKEAFQANEDSKQAYVTDNPAVEQVPRINQAPLNNLFSGEMMLGNIPTMQMMNNTEIEQQSTAICLQQQQSQLMVALQLKAQEESLAALHERHEESRRVQKEVVSAHREQLEQLLKGQTEHRTQLHNIMMQHQHRINQHIQALLKPSSSYDDKEENKTGPTKDETNLKINIGNDQEGITRTISEREQLESMIINLKENHSKELDIMENSYRHQVHLINESLTSIEDRLKSENENLTNYYLRRMGKLEQEVIQVTEQADEKTKTLQEKFTKEREEMEKKHIRDIEILKEQNQAVVNNIRDTIALERSTIKDATEYSGKLDSILKDVEKNNVICTDNVEKMNSRYGEDLQIRENLLATKEKQVSVLLENLESNRSTIERESQEIRTNLRNWEERLHIQSKAIDEEKLSLKFGKMELQNEKEIHTREKENFRVIIDRERDTMKRNIDSVQEKYSEMEKEVMDKSKKLEEDKSQIDSEKKKIEDMKKNMEELQRNIKIELNDVRENKKNVIDTQDKLHQSETALATRYQELETLTRSALAKHSIAERKVSEANYAQQKYEERMKELQEFALSLSDREQQVTRDKMALSRERLTFYNMQKEYKCEMCKSSNKNALIDLSKYSTSPNHNLNLNYFEMGVPQLTAVDNEKMKRKDILKRSNIDSVQSPMPTKDYTLEGLRRNVDFMKQYEKPPPLFQEIVDPRLLLLKLEIQNSIRNQKTDLSDRE